MNNESTIMTTSYKNNYLSNVIFRIDYPRIEELRKSCPDKLKKELLKTLPILEQIQQSGLQLKFTGKEFKSSENDLTKITWQFKNKEKNISAEIDMQYLAIVFKTYTNYSDFKKVTKAILDIFFKKYPKTTINRIGLRYINQIKIDGTDTLNWSKYINSNLTNNLNFIKDNKEGLRRAMNNLITLTGDNDTYLDFKYGIFNIAFPNEILEKEYVLDYDIFIKSPTEKKSVLTNLDAFNKKATEYFETSITKKLRETLNK